MRCGAAGLRCGVAGLHYGATGLRCGCGAARLGGGGAHGRQPAAGGECVQAQRWAAIGERCGQAAQADLAVMAWGGGDGGQG